MPSKIRPIETLKFAGSDEGDMTSRATVEARLLDPLAGPEWDLLVQSHPNATIFHSAAWARVLVKSYGHNPFYLHFLDGGSTLALVPLMEVRSFLTGNRGVTLPFSDSCAPLLFQEAKAKVVTDRLKDMARERGWSHFETRSSHGTEQQEAGTRYHVHILNLHPELDRLFANCSSSVRRAVRKAEKSELTVETSRSWESVLDFYRLHAKTRRRHGAPPQPLRFFRNIFTEIIEPGLGFVVLTKAGSRPAAAAMFFHAGSTAIYKFAASDPALQEHRGSNLAIWEGVRFLKQRRCEQLHFGRTSFDNDSLRRFKLGWGVKEETVRYLKWNTSAGEWVTGSDRATGIHTRIFSQLPLVLNRLAGSLIYPHLD